jgi:hypothetical protein
MKFRLAACIFSRQFWIVIVLTITAEVSAQGDTAVWKYRLSGKGMAVTGNVERFLLTLRGSFSVTGHRFESVLTPSYVFGEQNRKAAERDLIISLYNRLYPRRKLYGLALRSTVENSYESIVLADRKKNDIRWTFGVSFGN